MDNVIDNIIEITKDPYKRARDWKEATGGKVIGCFPMHVPEEIVSAAGMLPVTLLGNEKKISLADEYLQPSVCHLARGNLGLALDGELNFLDGVIFPDICDVIKNIPDIWRLHHPLPFHHNLLVQGKLTSASARNYTINQFDKLKQSLGEIAGSKISVQALRQSISIHNQNRELLSNLYRVRRDNPQLLRTSDVARVVMASMLMPKEEHNRLMHQLLKELSGVTKPSKGGVKVVLSGLLCDEPAWEILDLVEELGMVVADDDLYVGRRYFATKVREDIDPIEALAEHYIQDIPCPTKHYQADRWAEYLIDLVRDAGAKAIIILMLKFCEVHAFDYPWLKARFESEGIPHLLIEVEPPLSPGRLRTSLEAVSETLMER